MRNLNNPDDAAPIQHLFKLRCTTIRDKGSDEFFVLSSSVPDAMAAVQRISTFRDGIMLSAEMIATGDQFNHACPKLLIAKEDSSED